MSTPDDEPVQTEAETPLSPRARQLVEHYLEQQQAGIPAAESEALRAIARHAPALIALCSRNPKTLGQALERPLDQGHSEDELRSEFMSLADPSDPAFCLLKSLRQRRDIHMIRIALREIFGLADVDQTSKEIAWMAAGAIDAALAQSRTRQRARWGEALSDDGEPVRMTVLGMGKLGGFELNFGSDVDLCFFYETDRGMTEDGEHSIHEFMSRVCTGACQLLSEVTEDGFCFRVDLRLRPEGSRGPVANSLASAERYYTSWGRTWERGVLLRSAPIAGDIEFGRELKRALLPFIFRREVEPDIADQMYRHILQARKEVKPDPERELKLSRGGIREAEFFVQSNQLIWGGQHPELQTAGTVDSIRRLSGVGLIARGAAEDLEADWALLRRVEHRIHMWRGYQTHTLPDDEDEMQEFSASLGYTSTEALMSRLAESRTRIANLMEDLVGAAMAPESEHPLWPLCLSVSHRESADAILSALPPLGVYDSDAALAHLQRLGRWADSPLGPIGRSRHPEFALALLEEVSQATNPDAALQYLTDFVTKVRGVKMYLRPLRHSPQKRRRLIGLFGASPSLAQALIGHPETLNWALKLEAPPTPEHIRTVHQEAVAYHLETDFEPEDATMTLRRLQRELTLHIGLSRVSHEVNDDQVPRLLSAIADAQIEAAHAFGIQAATERHGALMPSASVDPCLCVVALGKLGALELGFGSDLDLIFVYEGEGETVSGTTVGEYFTTAARQMVRYLSDTNVEGHGYSTDTRLRPNGTHGMLVVSAASFSQYYARRAQDWERQALTKARVVTGEPKARARLEQLVTASAYESGAPDAERTAELRGRLELELGQETATRWHPKLGFGALMDIEFIVQYLQMTHGSHPELRCRTTDGAIERLRQAEILSDQAARGLLNAWYFFRGVLQGLRLLEIRQEPHLRPGGPRAEQLARWLGLRARDDGSPAEALLQDWIRHAEATRTLFETTIAPIGSRSPFRRDAY